ncbi:hypothetical protein A2U01_0051337, partial [Trifolium medium]|nr:hypothetical protein [Trifolium medium]
NEEKPKDKENGGEKARIKGKELVVVRKPLPELPDASPPATTLPWLSPLPLEPPDVARDAALLPSSQPPEPSHAGSRGVRFTIAEVGKVLERVRVKGEIDGKLSNTSVIHVFPSIGELIASLNLPPPQPPEPPDMGSRGASSPLAMTLLRQVPPPKPPNLGD